MEKEYALYKGDDLLAMGTLAEIAFFLGVKRSTILYYKSKAYARRTNEIRARRLIEI